MIKEARTSLEVLRDMKGSWIGEASIAVGGANADSGPDAMLT